MNLYKITARWTSSLVSGLPGYSNFYCAAGATPSLFANFFATFQAFLPAGVDVSVLGNGFIIDDVTGANVDVWTTTAPAVVHGSGVASFGAASGAVVDWRTAGIVNSRFVKGRTFIVPLAGEGYDANGTIKSTALTAIKDGADTLVAACATATHPLRIWARPFHDDPPHTPVRPDRPGSSYAVTSTNVPDMAAVLRSRRD